MAEPAALLAVRQQIAAQASAFRATFESKTVRRLMGELQGEQTKRVPKGFLADDPAADLLRHKSFILYTKLDPDIVTLDRCILAQASEHSHIERVLPGLVSLLHESGQLVLMGGLSTFSTFSAEVVQRLQDGRLGWAAGEIVIHVGASLVMTILGIATVSLLAR